MPNSASPGKPRIHGGVADARILLELVQPFLDLLIEPRNDAGFRVTSGI
jgi:hypothetical protein